MYCLVNDEKTSLMDFVYIVLLILIGLCIVLSETINILRKLQKKKIGMPSPQMTIGL